MKQIEEKNLKVSISEYKSCTLAYSILYPRRYKTGYNLLEEIEHDNIL